jgi:glycosyltransferase involved in cell wall biosynthesis
MAVKKLRDPYSIVSRLRRMAGTYRRRLHRRPSAVEVPRVLGLSLNQPGPRAGRALLLYRAWPPTLRLADALRDDRLVASKSMAMAESLMKLGYEVDVIDQDDHGFSPTSDYDLFIGLSDGFNRLLPMMPQRCISIFWGTGCHYRFTVSAHQRRLLWLAQRHGLADPPVLEPRAYERDLDLRSIDGVIALGNDFVAATYRPYARRVESVHNYAADLPAIDPATRSRTARRNRFVYMGSYPLVHKGLDLVLEAFASNPQFELDICAPVTGQLDFCRFYRRELFHTPNIRTLGWVGLYSEVFQEVATAARFVVFPSCSEAHPGSVINTMAAGLIPIVTREVGLDVEDFGFLLDDASPQSIARKAAEVAALSDAELDRRSMAAVAAVKRRYSHSEFGARFGVAVRSIIDARRAKGG